MASQWFSEAERVEMATPVIKRIKTAIKKRDTAKAIALCEDLKLERIVLHDFFTDCLAAMFTWMGENLGEDKLSDMFIDCFENSSRRPIYDLLGIDIDRGLEAELLVRGWVGNSCSGAGEHTAAFRMEEDDEKFIFTMDPCGSGGKLLSHNAYRPLSPAKKAVEKMEVISMRLAMKLPLPLSLQRFSIPFTLDYFCEMRRPAGMGTTKSAYDWSGDRKGMPYYCCICTSFMRETGAHWLRVHPPEGRRELCVWRAAKSG